MTPASLLTAEELQRYDRQILLPNVGTEGQNRLRRSSVLVVGLGGLGSTAAFYLAAAGVGRLGLLDDERVDASNLQRQILHTTGSIGELKTTSAHERLAALNPTIRLDTIVTRLTDGNATEILRPYDIALGCVDNFATRYALNRACLEQGKANVYGAASGFDGQASVFCQPGGPCYQCFFREPPTGGEQPLARDRAVLGTTPGIIGCIQANEALKVLLKVGKNLSGRLLVYDGLGMAFRTVAVQADVDCPACYGGIARQGMA